MSNLTIGIICIIILFILLAMKMWVGMAMALCGFLGMVLMRGFAPAWQMMHTATFNNIASYSLTVMPMFVFMGCIISETDIGKNLYKTMHILLGRLRGGLAYATVGATGFLGAITGSQLTGAIVMTKVALPEMEKLNYKDELSTGCIAAASPLGILIPPSTTFIIYGLLTEISIGKLFISGIIPGLITIAVFFMAIALWCRIDENLAPASAERYSFKEKIKSLINILPILILFLLVMAGIYAGWFTATEAGAIGAFGALAISLATRQMTWKKFTKSLEETVKLMGMIILQMVGTYIFSAAMTMSGLPAKLGAFVGGMNLSRIVVILAIILLYLILGCFIPEFSMVMLTVPILFPVIKALDFDPIWFGVLIVVLMSIAMLTPPVGMVVYTLGGISKKPVGTIFRGVAPFIIAEVVVVAILIAFPQVATWLPGIM
jgi:C4-dicarboxylate transporter DctM subunit